MGIFGCMDHEFPLIPTYFMRQKVGKPESSQVNPYTSDPEKLTVRL